MNFEQPTSVPTDEQVEAHLTALRVQITDKQAEIVRQEAIITSNRYTIQQTANEKAEILAQVAELTPKRDALVKEIEEKSARLEEVTGMTKILQADLLQKQIEAAKKQSEMDEKEKELIQNVGQFSIQTAAFEDYKAKVYQKEIELDGVKTQLKAIIN